MESMLTTKIVQQLEQLGIQRIQLHNQFKTLEEKENELLKQIQTIRNEQNKIATQLKNIQEKTVWELIPKLR